MQRTLNDIRAQAIALRLIEPNENPPKSHIIQRLREHFRGATDLPFYQKLKLADLNDLSANEQAHVWKSDQYVAEPKENGLRCRAYLKNGRLRFSSVTLSTRTFNYTEIACLGHLAIDLLEGSILEGELVSDTDVLDTGKTVTKNRLQAAVALTSMAPDAANQIQKEQASHLRFRAFDVLFHAGRSLMNQPLFTRRGILEGVRGNEFFSAVKQVTGDKEKFFSDFVRCGGEGVVLKCRYSTYVTEGRPRDCWIKVKSSISIDAFVSGVFSSRKQRAAGLEFSVTRNGIPFMIARVASLPDEFRRQIENGHSPLGRVAELGGMCFSPKSGRIMHAKILRWREGMDSKDFD